MIISRYVGASSDSAQPFSLIRWIIEEIKERYKVGPEQLDIPDEPKKIIEVFPDWLELAAQEGPLLLVIDAVNQLLPNSDDALHMGWLPKVLPKSVKVILTTTQSCLSYEVMQQREYKELCVQPLTDAECTLLITNFLSHYGKTLDENQIASIFACSRTRNPLFLVTFLQEVRVFGSYETLNTRINHYLGAETVSELFFKVLLCVIFVYPHTHTRAHSRRTTQTHKQTATLPP